jgi:hypothetical protein
MRARPAWLQALRLQDMTSQMMAEMSDDFIKQLEDLTEVDKKIGACLALDGWMDWLVWLAGLVRHVVWGVMIVPLDWLVGWGATFVHSCRSTVVATGLSLVFCADRANKALGRTSVKGPKPTAGYGLVG